MNAFLQETWKRRDEMTRELYVRYPRLLSPNSVGQYLAYGPGWIRLVDAFFACVDHRLSDELAVRFRIDQIKEKFGVLKIHYSTLEAGDGYDEQGPDIRVQAVLVSDFPLLEINAIKAVVERLSSSTCFFCGAPGIRRQTLWTHVSCDACEKTLEPSP